MDVLGMLYDLTGFGSAGLMAMLWLWERRLSRLREEQLSESHARIRRDEQRMTAVAEAMERNTAAFTRFCQIQGQLERTLAQLAQEVNHAKRPV